jgi:hypothetical protein
VNDVQLQFIHSKAKLLEAEAEEKLANAVRNYAAAEVEFRTFQAQVAQDLLGQLPAGDRVCENATKLLDTFLSANFPTNEVKALRERAQCNSLPGDDLPSEAP